MFWDLFHISLCAVINDNYQNFEAFALYSLLYNQHFCIYYETSFMKRLFTSRKNHTKMKLFPFHKNVFKNFKHFSCNKSQ